MAGDGDKQMEQSELNDQSVLVLEDDLALAKALTDFLEQEGWSVESATTAAEARSKLEQQVFDLVLADYLLPDADGLTIFEEIQKRSPLTKVMMMTGVQDMEVAARAFREGAADLIPKPFKIADLERRISLLMEYRSQGLELVEGKESEKGVEQPSYIIGESLAIKKVLHLVSMVASKEASVLISGESGTGKELVARAIHDLSPRKDESFVAINCGAIPENLLEDELFGHVKGAYTDARNARTGKLEQASGGTLFLDEIGDMPAALQVKLLRVIEEKTFQRLGSNHTVRCDFRLVTATNTNLREKVKEGSFREDLFYRLNVVPVHVPPLRERPDDVALLATHFLKTFARQYGEAEKKLDPVTLKMLSRYEWPGNIRELRNAIELGFVLSGERKTIRLEDFPTLLESMDLDVEDADEVLSNVLELPEDGVDLNQVVSEVEKNLITQSLQRTGGNKGKAARLLYLKRTTLVEKLRRMNLLEEF